MKHNHSTQFLLDIVHLLHVFQSATDKTPFLVPNQSRLRVWILLRMYFFQWQCFKLKWALVLYFSDDTRLSHRFSWTLFICLLYPVLLCVTFRCPGFCGTFLVGILNSFSCFAHISNSSDDKSRRWIYLNLFFWTVFTFRLRFQTSRNILRNFSFVKSLVWLSWTGWI